MEHGPRISEVGDVLRLWSRFLWRRVSRARVGVLEDVLSPCGYSADGSRRRRGYNVDIPRAGTWAGL